MQGRLCTGRGSARPCACAHALPTLSQNATIRIALSAGDLIGLTATATATHRQHQPGRFGAGLVKISQLGRLLGQAFWPVDEDAKTRDWVDDLGERLYGTQLVCTQLYAHAAR